MRAGERAARVMWRFIARNKLATIITAVFVVFVIVVVANAGGAPAPAARHDPPAADFTVPALGSTGTSSGKTITLSRQYAGQPVIVNFWASWCQPCQRETPLLASWYREQHGSVNLIGLDENDSAASALKFARAKGVTYPLGFDPKVRVADAYGVSGAGIPQTFFLDKSHRVVDHIYGPLTTADLDRGLALTRG
ncbi:MAG: TlpA family protein disulfide reductase [Nocardiopsaceae bacterium]|nr:TlpA family protein disulfide reductase [Nocardiopsaceae bacterium]